MKLKFINLVVLLFVFSQNFKVNSQTNTATSGNFNLSNTWTSPNQVANGITILNGHTVSVTTNSIFYSGKITLSGNGKLQLIGTGKWMPGPAIDSFKNCKEIIYYYPMSPSGVYTIDPDGADSAAPTSCYCDMVTDGGGWTLVLNYLHLGGTNPALKTFSSSLPILGSSSLGTDEFDSSTTWGHTIPAYLNKFTFSELRFYGKTSGHTRIIHFKTTHSNTINYFKSGDESMTGINTTFAPLVGHTAFLPGSAAHYYTHQGDDAMTNFPFWRSSTYHWGIMGLGYRWEVDDYPGNFVNDTHHQIWIR